MVKRAVARVLLLGAAFAAACESPIIDDYPHADLVSFAVPGYANGLAADARIERSADTISVVFDAVADVRAIVPTFSTDRPDASVTVDDTTIVSGRSAIDLTRVRRLRVSVPGAEPVEYVLTAVVFTGLPVIYLATDAAAPILDRENYVNATLRVLGGPGHADWSVTARTQVRGRGNSTWGNPKKPYRLKLSTSASLMGFPADRDWTLLANYWDLPLARNATAFAMSAMLGMAFTPRCTPVELFLNGAHQGAYQLCDHMEVAANRVPATANGWFLELNDIRRVEPDETWFSSPVIQQYTTVGHGDSIPSVWIYKQPDPPSAAQRAQVEGEMLDFERVLYGPLWLDPDSGYARLLDTRALADWYLVQELTKNNDAAFSFGVYVYRAPGGRISFGPVWDFDLAFGNYPYDFAPTGWKIQPSGYLPRLFADPAFVALVKERWAVLRGRRAELDQFIVDYTSRLDRSQRLNHALWWPYLPRPLLRAGEAGGVFAAISALSPVQRTNPHPWAFTDADYAAAVREMRDWLSARFDWLDARFSAM